ncbi:MAG: ABC transporter ATP-binding protein [Lachnospirales bacterium]
MKEIIKVEKVVKIYSAFKGAKEHKALDEISFEIFEGEFVGIMGASGSGKTTLLNILSGIDRLTTGSVYIEDLDIAHLKNDELVKFRRQKIGYIFQDFNLLDSLTLKENIALPLILDKKKPDDIEDKVLSLMEFFNIGDLSEKYQFHISGGQKQRVAAARALVNDPLVCFADEPTGNLDSKSSKNVMDMLTEINEKRGSTILMVTHDPFAASFCNKILFIKDGKLNFVVNKDKEYSRKQFFEQILELQSTLGSEE